MKPTPGSVTLPPGSPTVSLSVGLFSVTMGAARLPWMSPRTTDVVADDNAVLLEYPAARASTRTVINVLRSAAARVYVDAVAPAMATPLRSHW